MRLSDTRNPRTGSPFTVAQIETGAAHFGLIWRADNADDPALSAALAQAAVEQGWNNPSATLRRAVQIQNAPTPDHSVRWNAGRVFVDGVLRDDLSARLVRELPGAVGDPATGRIDAPDIEAVERCKISPRPAARKTTQCWDEDEPTYH